MGASVLIIHSSAINYPVVALLPSFCLPMERAVAFIHAALSPDTRAPTLRVEPAATHSSEWSAEPAAAPKPATLAAPPKPVALAETLVSGSTKDCRKAQTSASDPLVAYCVTGALRSASRRPGEFTSRGVVIFPLVILPFVSERL